MKICKLLFALFIALSMTACSLTIPKAMANDLMKDIPAKTVTGKAADDKFIRNTADFSVELFKKTIDEKRNSLVSPLSVMLALSMTANGADNETLSQMGKVLGNDKTEVISQNVFGTYPIRFDGYGCYNIRCEKSRYGHYF
jgi:serpin B